MKTDNELLALTGLRFVAAFYVFIFHIHINWPLTKIEFLKNVLEQGAVGMSLFFILSGFILAHRYSGEAIHLREYFTNRFARIYPIYLVAALVTLPWIGISLGGQSVYDYVKFLAQGTILVVSNIFILQAWFPQFFGFWNNGGSWSISVEAFCYLIFPFVVPALLRLSKKKLLLATFGFYVLAVLPGLVGTLFPGGSFAVYYAMPIFRAPEFLAGTCVLLIARKFGCNQFTHWHQFAAIASLLFYFSFFGPMVSNYVGHNWIVVPFLLFLIFTLANGEGIFARIMANPISVWLGKISYCFYSFQILVLKLLIDYRDKLLDDAPILAEGKVVFLVALIAILILSAIGHYLIEEPARRKLRAIYRG
jgi:peptidoglycan/LPS O-acetylase OafA/YrhL